MASIILREPELIRQTKANSCWYACLKMLLKWHEGSSTIDDKSVRKLASQFVPRSYEEIPSGFLAAHNVRVEDENFASTDGIAEFLSLYGPFVGGGKVGKFFVGKRRFGHAILIYGVMPNGQVLHHDPTLGARCKIKGDNYLKLQDGERMYYFRNPVVQIEAQGS